MGAPRSGDTITYTRLTANDMHGGGARRRQSVLDGRR